MKKATIKDVAKKANVSVTSVSFIFNGKDYKVSQETKDVVLKAAKELGYRPDQTARSLRTHKTNTVGFICPDICNGYYSTIAKKLEDTLNEENYTLIIGNSAYTFEKEEKYINEFSSRGVDCLVIAPCADSLKDRASESKLELALKNSGLRYLIVDRRTKFNKHFEIANDDVFGAKLMTNYLIDNGYQHIACITGPNNVSSSIDRLKGYKEALKEHNIDFDESLIKEGNYSNQSGISCIKSLLNEKREFDAVFAFNDLMAYGVYQVLNDNGINIPNEIAVVGCDDLYFSSLINPRLTSIKPSLDEMVAEVAKFVLNNENFFGTKLIKPSLSIKDSVRNKNHA